MDPVMLHADGTDCRHEGNARAAIGDVGGPLCPAGQPITHMRFNGKVITIEQAYASLKSVADTFAKMLTPMIAAFAEFGRRVGGAEPAIRALAAASAVVDEERQREAASGATT